MNNKTKQTAVDELWDYLKGWIPSGQYAGVREAYLEAKEKEKEQHEKTYNQSLMSNFQSFDHYYKETYGGNKVECQFEMDTSTSSATKCKFCGKEKWQHINGGNK